MKTSIFAAAATLLFAAFVAASPAPLSDLEFTPTAVEPRCKECDEACPKNNFYYPGTKCCLENGGPKNPPNPPNDKDCPKYWYWHDGKKCCAPRYPQQPNPQPSCEHSTYPKWDKNDHCCKPTGTNPPPPTNSRRATRDMHQPKSKYTGRKAELKNRNPEACPSGMIVCPRKDGLDCLESVREIDACGGCPTFGVGKDCTAIPNVMNVECNVSGSAPTCVVHSCKDGFTPSKDGTSCVAA